MDSHDFKLRTSLGLLQLATIVIYQTIIISDAANLVFAKKSQAKFFVIHKTFSSY